MNRHLLTVGICACCGPHYHGQLRGQSLTVNALSARPMNFILQEIILPEGLEEQTRQIGEHGPHFFTDLHQFCNGWFTKVVLVEKNPFPYGPRYVLGGRAYGKRSRGWFPTPQPPARDEVMNAMVEILENDFESNEQYQKWFADMVYLR